MNEKIKYGYIGLTKPEPLDAVIMKHILSALEYTGGNRSKAAAYLQISHRTLRDKLHKKGLSGFMKKEDDDRFKG